MTGEWEATLDLEQEEGLEQEFAEVKGWDERRMAVWMRSGGGWITGGWIIFKAEFSL